MKAFLLMLMCIVSLYAASVSRDNGNEVVMDYDNNLMWMDNKDTVTKRLTHKEAEPYCETLLYAGYANWRLPTIEEFQTIVDKRNTKNYIHRAFRYNQAKGYWALKAHFRTFWFYADFMNFVSGTAYFDNRNVYKFVRCVRTMR